MKLYEVVITNKVTTSTEKFYVLGTSITDVLNTVDIKIDTAEWDTTECNFIGNTDRLLISTKVANECFINGI